MWINLGAHPGGVRCMVSIFEHRAGHCQSEGRISKLQARAFEAPGMIALPERITVPLQGSEGEAVGDLSTTTHSSHHVCFNTPGMPAEGLQEERFSQSWNQGGELSWRYRKKLKPITARCGFLCQILVGLEGTPGLSLVTGATAPWPGCVAARKNFVRGCRDDRTLGKIFRSLTFWGNSSSGIATQRRDNEALVQHPKNQVPRKGQLSIKSPYSLEWRIDADLQTRSTFSGRRYDPLGKEASTKSVFRHMGTEEKGFATTGFRTGHTPGLRRIVSVGGSSMMSRGWKRAEPPCRFHPLVMLALPTEETIRVAGDLPGSSWRASKVRLAESRSNSWPPPLGRSKKNSLTIHHEKAGSGGL